MKSEAVQVARIERDKEIARSVLDGAVSLAKNPAVAMILGFAVVESQRDKLFRRQIAGFRIGDKDFGEVRVADALELALVTPAFLTALGEAAKIISPFAAAAALGK